MDTMKTKLTELILKIEKAKEQAFPRDQWISTPFGNKYSPNYGQVEYIDHGNAVKYMMDFNVGDIIGKEFMLRDGRAINLGRYNKVVHKYDAENGLAIRFHSQQHADLSEDEVSDYSDWLGDMYCFPSKFLRRFKVTR